MNQVLRSMIAFNGAELEVSPDDHKVLLNQFNSFAGSASVSIAIVTLDEGTRNTGKGNMYIVELDGRRIALKRCDNNQLFLRREVIVHHLRKLFGMNDYTVKRQEGIRLRSINTGTNCKPFEGWESTPFVIIDFGEKGMRKNFRKLQTNEIKDIQSFFEQYGEWSAFNYIVGAKDRHDLNSVYDLKDCKILSVDNEDRPLKSNGEFTDFNDQNDNIRNYIQKFLPSEEEQWKETKKAFARGFLRRWGEIQKIFNTAAVATDTELSAEDAMAQILHIKTVLEENKPEEVLARINV